MCIDLIINFLSSISDSDDFTDDEGEYLFENDEDMELMEEMPKAAPSNKTALQSKVQQNMCDFANVQEAIDKKIEAAGIRQNQQRGVMPKVVLQKGVSDDGKSTIIFISNFNCLFLLYFRR